MVRCTNHEASRYDCSEISCYVHLVGFRHLPQHTIRQHPQPTYTLMCVCNISTSHTSRNTISQRKNWNKLCCCHRCVIYQQELCGSSSGIYLRFRSSLPKPGHTVDFTERCISFPLYVRQLRRVRSQFVGTVQRTAVSRSIWTCPQKLLDGYRVSCVTSSYRSEIVVCCPLRSEK